MINYNKDFLLRLDKQKEKDIYIKIISLNVSGFPRETIEGKISGGSINIDGSSAIRRTCSLTLVAPLEDTIITDNYWCFNTQMDLKVGIKNNIDNNYPSIIWFDQGIYIITSFSINKSINNITINLQGKDKMCRLNGEVSGHIFAQTDFGADEVPDDETGNITLVKKPIKQIIRDALTLYGCEKEENIIINDLDDYGYELLDYNGKEPIYYFKDAETGNIEHITVDQDIFVYGAELENGMAKISELEACGGRYYSTNTLDPEYNLRATAIFLSPDQNKRYYIVKIDTDQTAGYHKIPLVYNTDLILNTGETITTLLDKIKNMLGHFEYFYNLQGQFVFQKKNNYAQELWSTSSGSLDSSFNYNDFYSYIFNNEELFTSVSISPNIENIKNDFSVQGVKKNTSTNIRARCAIDKKPFKYITPWPEDRKNNQQVYIAGEGTQKAIFDNKDKILMTVNSEILFESVTYDWRELIYQMAIDFLKHNQEPDFLIQIEKANSNFIGGQTGYEQYYTDMQSYWRELYCPFEEEKLKEEEYYSNIENYSYWNKKIHSNPMALTFWFEFIDTQGELEQYSVNKIGNRTTIISDNNINSIYYNSTPEIQFTTYEEMDKQPNTAYTEIQISDNELILFNRSSQGISAIEKINELIQNHSVINESLNINCIPIFYLQPNTRIQINAKEYNGDYTIEKISYNLNYNGTMSINCNKIFKELI